MDASPDLQIQILSDVFFTNLYPGIIGSSANLANIRVQTVVSGVTVEAWVNFTAGNLDSLKINSIYFVA